MVVKNLIVSWYVHYLFIYNNDFSEFAAQYDAWSLSPRVYGQASKNTMGSQVSHVALTKVIGKTEGWEETRLGENLLVSSSGSWYSYISELWSEGFLLLTMDQRTPSTLCFVEAYLINQRVRASRRNRAELYTLKNAVSKVVPPCPWLSFLVWKWVTHQSSALGGGHCTCSPAEEETCELP